jgi:hypothetical protein
MTDLNKQNSHQKADSPQFNYREITNCSFVSQGNLSVLSIKIKKWE